MSDENGPCICGGTRTISVTEFVTDENGEPVLDRDMHILERRVTVPCPECTQVGAAWADRHAQEAEAWYYATLERDQGLQDRPRGP